MGFGFLPNGERLNLEVWLFRKLKTGDKVDLLGGNGFGEGEIQLASHFWPEKRMKFRKE
jgi:hypothetical protein